MTIAQINDFDVENHWKTLKWQSGWFLKQNRYAQFPEEAGIYRVRLLKNISPKISDWQVHAATGKLTINIGSLMEGQWLSVGKASNLRNRMKQHLSAIKSSNRLLRNVRNLMSLVDDEMGRSEARQFIMNNIVVEYETETDWWKRDVLENYGKAILKPLFDIKAEY